MDIFSTISRSSSDTPSGKKPTSGLNASRNSFFMMAYRLEVMSTFAELIHDSIP